MGKQEAMEEAVPAKQEPKKTEQRRKERRPQQSADFFKCFYEADYLLFKGFCFFIYGAYGGFIPYLPLYFKQLFLGASYAGIIVGIRPLIQCIGAPFWGIIADRYHAGRIIFLGSVVAWIVKAGVLLTVRPHYQHCVEIYTNNTANLTYVYAYDLWNAEEEKREHWLVVPLDHPIVIKHNKIVTVDQSKGKENLNRGSQPGNALKKSGPVKQQKITENEEKAKANDSKAVQETKKRNVFMDDESESRELAPPLIDQVEDETTTAGNFEEMSRTLNLKLFRKAEVYSKELQAPIQFITLIDTSETEFMFILFLLIIVIGEFFESPTYALSDASLLKRLGDDRAYYGRIRMWGSLGWALASAMVGLIVMSSTYKLCEVKQNDYVIAFYIFIAFVAAAFVHGLWFRFKYDEEKNFEDIGKVAPLLLNLRHTSFLFATLYTGFCYGILVHFVNWYIDDLGGSSSIMGAAGAAREIAALIMFAFSTTALEALGNVNSMAFCLMSYIICFICYSILKDPWMAVALEVLDGGTYGLVWSTCVNYMSSVGSQLGIIETTQGKFPKKQYKPFHGGQFS